MGIGIRGMRNAPGMPPWPVVDRANQQRTISFHANTNRGPDDAKVECFLLGDLAGSRRSGRGFRPGLPDPSDRAGLAVPARRQRLAGRAHRRREDERDARPVGRGGEPRRRRRHHRGAVRGQEPARRLHAAARLHRHAGDRAEPLSQCGLRAAQGFRRHRPHRLGPHHAGGASERSGAFGRRIDRLCEGPSGRGQLRLGRHRHRRPPGGRAARHHGGRQAHPCALQGHRPGHHRSAGRPYPDDVHPDPDRPWRRPRPACCGRWR